MKKPILHIDAVEITITENNKIIISAFRINIKSCITEIMSYLSKNNVIPENEFNIKIIKYCTKHKPEIKSYNIPISTFEYYSFKSFLCNTI